MHKKTIFKRKHYSGIKRALDSFEIDLTGWYNFWHTHLDWSGYSNGSIELRQEHIKYYLELLDKVEQQSTKQYAFQTWILVHAECGGQDAIYLHTENPNSDFPAKFDNFEWINELPRIIPPIDMSVYKVGRIENDKGYHYIIQKRAVGLPISNSE